MKNSRTQSTRSATHRLVAVLLLFATLITGLPAWAAEEGSETPSAGPGVVNINTASIEQLKQLPRVGPALADRILAHREAQGDFESTEDLILVQGIGEKTYAMLSSFVVVKGETTLSRKLKTSDVPTSAAAPDSGSD